MNTPLPSASVDRARCRSNVLPVLAGRTAFATAILLTTSTLVSTGLSQAARPSTAPAGQSQADAGDVIELSPFTVEAVSDRSYGAINSNSITSFNTELGKLPMSADVFTSTFMDETNSTTLENMLREYSAGSGTGSAAGDVGGVPVNQPLDRGGGDSVSAGVQLRGLGAAVVKQDGFMLPSPAGTGLNSNFGVERVEVINGPQALLYGNGGGGGVINLISKQARFNRSATRSLKFQVDQHGHDLTQLDFSEGNARAAVTVSLLHQVLGDNRIWLGGPLNGAYAQAAVRVANTVFRLTGKQTYFDRFTPQNLVLNATSTTFDSRHGQDIRVLIATNQLDAAAAGANGAGIIGNGHISWDNVDSYGSQLREEMTTARLGSLSAETRWNSWLSTRISAGYQNKESNLGFGSGVSFYAPGASANPMPGQWTASAGGTSNAAYSSQPSRSYAFRFEALATNEFFGGRAHSQTMVGADYTEGHYANIQYAFYQADSDFNVITGAGGTRTVLAAPTPAWSVQDGPVRYPFVRPATPRVTINGVNYVSMIMNQTDPALVTPQNPQGVTGTQLFLHSRAISKGAFAVNYTQWGDGRLTTLAGMRYVAADNRQLPSTAIPEIRATASNVSYSLGANYRAASWLRPYVTVSDTYNLPGILLTVPTDPLGRPAQIAHSVGEEAGVKLSDERSRISGSFSVFAVQSSRDPYAIPSQLRDSINPAGINGRYLGATGTTLSIDRKSHGAQAAIVASPTPNWRMRLSAAFVQGTIGSSASYPALYNDQFYANGAGQVTYANGTVVYVRPTFLSTPGTSATAGYVPLTIEMLSSPTSAYYANPDPTNGALRSSNGRTILNNTTSAAVVANGPIKTGVAGLPISQYQLTGLTLPDTIVASRAGESTTGYPEYSANFTGVYTFSDGWLKGLKLGGTVNASWQVGDFYYYPNGYSPTAPRTLYMRPTRVLFDGIVGYERKLGRRFVWSTQVNVTNVFNRYSVLLRPNNVTGAPADSAIWSNQPRTYTWTNTLKF